MFVQLGHDGQPDFGQPIALMMDCHRRIEHFLQMLVNVTQRYGRRELDDEGRVALEAALDYFRHAAPRHIADEEESLFPRMRNSDDHRLTDALDELDRLEGDHRQVEAAHQRIDQLGRYWLDARTLDQASLEELSRLLKELVDSYTEHIGMEDQRVFALANTSLDADSIKQIGREMRQRRAEPSGRSDTRSTGSSASVLAQTELSRFVEAVATTPSVPASGCVAALVGALAAALAQMIVSLSRSDSQDAVTQLKQVRGVLLGSVDRDADAFRTFQLARKRGNSAEALLTSGINDVPADVAKCCLSAIECIEQWVPQVRPTLKAEAYAALALAMAAIDVSRFNLVANAQFLKHADAERARQQVSEIHEEAMWHHRQIAAALKDAHLSACKG